MRLRMTAAALAAVTVSGFLAVGTAAAAAESGTILYVDNSAAANCSDQTSDSASTPYCTIQAAVNAAVAGDTVQVKAGDTFTGETDVTASGTSSAPITIESSGGTATVNATGDTYGFYINGAAYVDLSGLTVVDAATDVQVSASQHIGISGTRLISSSTSSNGVALYQSSDSQVSTSYFQGPFASSAGINVYGGGAGDDVITTNVFTGQHSNAIIDTAVPDVAITSNTIVGLCGNGISVNAGDAGFATGSTIENNILAEFSCAGTTGILTDAQDTAAINYNIVYPDQESTLDYYWTSGDTATSYISSAAFCAATTYGCDDLNTNPDVDADETLDAGQIESGSSSAINSANSDATGELATDFAGNARTNDPYVTDTGVGTYTDYDRGAYQYQDPFQTNGATELFATATPDDVFSSDITASIPGGAWGPVNYTYAFGDGTASVTTTESSEIHHYAKLGTYTVTVTAVDSTGETQTVTTQSITAGSEFTAFGPARLLDTRKGLGAPKTPVASGNSVALQIAGTQGLPSSGITAVALHVTAVDTTGSGYVAVDPDGTTGGASLLNFGADQTVSNSVIVPVAADGKIDLTVSGVNSSVRADLIADVTGYFTGTTASGYTSVAPARLLDTRSGLGAAKSAVQGGHHITLTIAGADGGALPASGITAVSLNLTAVDGTGSGYVTAYPDAEGSTPPASSNLNYLAGQVVASTAIVPVGTDGKIDLYVGGSTAQTVDLIADVQGYYSASGTAAYVPVDPVRAIDTRKSGGPLAQDDGTVTFDPLNLNSGTVSITLPNGTGVLDYNLPTDAAAWDFNLTAVQGTAHGLITAYPVLSASTPVPAVSNLNYGPGQTVANFAQVTGGTADPWQSSVSFTNSQAHGTVQLISDLYGFYGAN